LTQKNNKVRMSMDSSKNGRDWASNLETLLANLKVLSITDRQGMEMPVQDGFEQWLEAVGQLRRESGCVYFVGNGASASMASHFATDLAKNGGARTQVFTDLSLLTALGNDIRFAEVFAEPLNWYARPGDMLVAISSSGNSPNIVRAVEVIREKQGQVVTISGFNRGNAIRQLGDINFYFPSTTYGQAETGHAIILHYWMDLVESSFKMERGRP
jgi:D-sedoheptulose 7-phosphate isomerase